MSDIPAYSGIGLTPEEKRSQVLRSEIDACAELAMAALEFSAREEYDPEMREACRVLSEEWMRRREALLLELDRDVFDCFNGE